MPFTPYTDKHDPRGSIWRRWDLHIHTPKSLVHHYPGGDTSEGWERFLTDLERLPPEFKVIGINDYLFIDGYENVLNEKKRGRLPNIDLILPVVELRLDRFGGTETDWNKVNYHVIFSSHVTVEDIKTHFLNRLASNHSLWSGAINMRTLSDFGQRVLNAIPLGRPPATTSSLHAGFHHLTFGQEHIQNLLEATPFQNSFLIAVGKAEWQNMKWEKAIADKRTIIDSADLLLLRPRPPMPVAGASRGYPRKESCHRCLTAVMRITRSRARRKIGSETALLGSRLTRHLPASDKS